MHEKNEKIAPNIVNPMKIGALICRSASISMKTFTARTVKIIGIIRFTR